MTPLNHNSVDVPKASIPDNRAKPLVSSDTTDHNVCNKNELEYLGQNNSLCLWLILLTVYKPHS